MPTLCTCSLQKIGMNCAHSPRVGEKVRSHLIYPRFRQALKRLVVKKSFDYSILFFIALNCITLAMERPSIPPISFVRLSPVLRDQTIIEKRTPLF